MRFSVFVPEQAEHGRVPALFGLAGLTCTEETFMIKAGVQRLAAQSGLMLISPDTSPRDTGIADENKDSDFGTGPGFYIDARASPWSEHYRMHSYIVNELYAIATQDLPEDPAWLGIFGHSMGGHVALVLALRNPDKFRCVSAFVPIADQPLTLRRHEGYDHSRYFIFTFIEDHIRFHLARLT